MKKDKLKCLLTLVLLLSMFLSGYSQDKPNIVLIFPDNTGVGEVASFGGSRGVPTPNIDKLGEDGIRLTNFNVEISCIPSRIALLTGRYPARLGNYWNNGATLWENTIAELLKNEGYATAAFGKWHVSDGTDWVGKQEPTDQGFDEWYGIPNSSGVSQFTSFEGFPDDEKVPYIWEGVTGQASKKVKPYDLNTRRTIDREAAIKGVNFIRKNAKKNKPFFLYYPITQLHFPTLPHPDKEGTTGAGDMGDAMADIDYNTGLILEELKNLGIEENTLVIWCTDNGAERRIPWRGNAGPWRGYYNSAMEGGIRTPCVMRWPGHIESGRVSNDIVNEVDIFATIAAIVKSPMSAPNDRIIDGKNHLAFLEGEQTNSNRESSIVMNRAGKVMTVKWHNWKLWYHYVNESEPDSDNLTRLFDLTVDPREERDVKDYYPWVIGIMDSIVNEYEKSLIEYPRFSGNAHSDDAYLKPIAGPKELSPTYTRTDRGAVYEKPNPIANPDFSGSWSTTEITSVSPLNRVVKQKVATLGSGWGDRITIVHHAKSLEVGRVVFGPRDLQPIVTYNYALDNSTSENIITMGRGIDPLTSTTEWKGDKLAITTLFPYQNPNNGEWHKSKMVQTLWLETSKKRPWEPTLIVETYREGVLGGLSSTNRTTYTKGYR